METLFYFTKVALTSGVLFLYYRLFLKDKTFHHYNRFYLLASAVISVFLPLLRMSYFTIELHPQLFLWLSNIQQNTIPPQTNDFPIFKIVFTAIAVVSVFILSRFFLGIFKLETLKKKYKKQNYLGIHFYHTDLEEAPFSFFKNLFWKDSIFLKSPIGQQILKHEMVHIEQNHSLDKVIMEVLTAVFWFNPIFYLFKKELHLIHEYLADHQSVQHTDTKAFAQMLLASHFSGIVMPAANPFLNSNLKKRLKMLQKPKTRFGYVRRIFALPLAFMLAFAYMVQAKNKEIKELNLKVEKALPATANDTISKPAVTLEAKTKVKSNAEEVAKAAEKAAEEAEKVAKQAEEVGKQAELAGAEAEKTGRENEKMARVAEAKAREQAELTMKKAELAKEQAILMKQQAELAKKSAELAKKMSEISGNSEEIQKYQDKNTIYIESKSGDGTSNFSKIRKTIVVGKSDGSKMDFGKVKIFIDGEETPRDNLGNLLPDNIEKINIYKEKDGIGRIMIETKKK